MKERILNTSKERPRHSFETFEDLALQGTTFEPRAPPTALALARGAAGACGEEQEKRPASRM